MTLKKMKFISYFNIILGIISINWSQLKNERIENDSGFESFTDGDCSLRKNSRRGVASQ